MPKKGGGGGHFTWGTLGSELLDDYTEELDEDDLLDLQYNEAKEKFLIETSNATGEKKTYQPKSIENLDKDIKPIIDEYFANGDANDAAQSIRKFNLKQLGDGELLTYVVTLALEKSNVHKELASRLLHDLYGIVFRVNDYITGYDTLLTTLGDLSLDNPECSTDIGKEKLGRKFRIIVLFFRIGKFIARSIADKCIDNTNGTYFARYKGNVKCPKMQIALDKAETLMSMGDFYFLNNVWGAQSSRLKKKIFLKKVNIYFFKVAFDLCEN